MTVRTPARSSLLAGALVFLFAAGWADAHAQKSPQVEEYLVQASRAGRWLQEGDIAQMESELEAGFNEIALMMDSYRPDGKTNSYLRQRGWGQLIWTQMMYRLLAIRDGLFDEELEFAERVALESVSSESLRSVEVAFARIQILMAAKEKMNLNQEIDQFAQGIFGSEASGTSYRALVDDFQARFSVRQAAVVARLASGQHRGIFDPSELPVGTSYAQVYQDYQERMQSENRLDEIFNRLAGMDPARIEHLADVAQNAPTAVEREAARNEVKLQLLLVESTLAASDSDPSVARMMNFYDRWGHLAFDSYPGTPDDFQETMSLVHAAKNKWDEQLQLENLRDLYAIADQVR